MLHLSTKEVVLSIEKAELEIKHGIIYQKYPNFFGNTFNFDFGKKENFEKLENQTNLNRLKLSKHDIDMKKLTVFFMNSSITQALEKKFNTNDYWNMSFFILYLPVKHPKFDRNILILFRSNNSFWRFIVN